MNERLVAACLRLAAATTELQAAQAEVEAARTEVTGVTHGKMAGDETSPAGAGNTEPGSDHPHQRLVEGVGANG